MRTRLSPTVSRIAALGLLAGVIGLMVVSVMLPAWHKYRNDRIAITEHRENIARFGKIGANLELLRAALETHEYNRERNPNVLKQESPSLAAAGLQQRLKANVEASGGKLTSARVLAASEDGALTRVTLRVRISVSTEALHKVLYELESAVPYLVIENLTVNSRAARARKNTRRAIPPLDVRFDLSGFMNASAG